MSTERITEIRERLEKASNPPWELSEGTCHTGEIATIHGVVKPGGTPTWVEIWSRDWPSGTEEQGANAQLILHAPADLESLLTRLEAAERVIGFYADPASVKPGAKWSEGYPGGIVYDEGGAAFLDLGQTARRFLEGE